VICRIAVRGDKGEMVRSHLVGAWWVSTYVQRLYLYTTKGCHGTGIASQAGRPTEPGQESRTVHASPPSPKSSRIHRSVLSDETDSSSGERGDSLYCVNLVHMAMVCLGVHMSM
jgi:hypothetical protein